MKLDLSHGAVLEPAHRDSLNAIALEIRPAFNELVCRLGAAHADAIDWWVTPVASRNIFACALFARCCRLLLALRVAESGGPVSAIVVDSPGLAAALEKALARRHPGVSVQVRRGAPWWRVKLYAGMGYRLAAAGFHAFNQILFARIFAPAARLAPRAPIILIDTFVYRDSFDRGYRDRHYPGLLECLSEEERQRVFFLPAYYKIRNYPRLFRALRASRENFLVKEDFLRPGDYAHALAHPWRSLGFTVDKCDFEGIEVAPLVNESLYESFASSGTIEGLLRYRLAQRIRESGLPVALVVDWFENQEIDHGSNAGFRRFLPDTPIVGYQGFIVSRHYLCMFPTREEMRLGLIPHRVAVMGSALTQGAREFCPGLEVSVAPAFRFAGLWRAGKERIRSEQFRILVALPLMRQESAGMLDLMASAAGGFPPVAAAAPWRIRVKAHPARVQPLPRNFGCVDGDFDDLLDDCDVLVSSASSVCVQALAHGVPVIVLGSRHDVTLNPVPDEVERELWTVCYTAPELTAALSGYARRDAATIARHRALGAAWREKFFTPVTRETVRGFLMLGAEGQRIKAAE